MAYPFFYISAYHEGQTELILDEDNSRHIVQVLRMKPGERLLLTDGRGRVLTVSILDDHKKKCRVGVESVELRPRPRERVVIGISLLKNTGRFEWFLEKAMEMGVSGILPLICERTEKQHFRVDRMKSILVSALLQSQQAWLPDLPEPQAFDRVVGEAAGTETGLEEGGEGSVREDGTGEVGTEGSGEGGEGAGETMKARSGEGGDDGVKGVRDAGEGGEEGARNAGEGDEAARNGGEGAFGKKAFGAGETMKARSGEGEEEARGPAKGGYSRRLIAHCLEERRLALADIVREGRAKNEETGNGGGAGREREKNEGGAEKRGMQQEGAGNEGGGTLILIGPEGDFSKAEIDRALERGFLPVTLGDTRLRTETAGMVAAALLCIC